MVRYWTPPGDASSKPGLNRLLMLVAGQTGDTIIYRRIRRALQPTGVRELLSELTEGSGGPADGWVYLLNLARLREQETVLTALPYHVTLHH